MELILRVLPGRFAICKLASTEPIPAWATAGDFFSIARTPDELSVVCPEAAVPAGIQAQRGWRCLRVVGTIEFSVVGVLALLVEPLAKAGISIFVVSTFDTDYLLVSEKDFDRALETLREAGHSLA